MAPTKIRECSAAFLFGSECEADKGDAAPDQDQAEDIAHHESSTLMSQEPSPSLTGTISIQSPFYKPGAEEVPKRDSETKNTRREIKPINLSRHWYQPVTEVSFTGGLDGDLIHLPQSCNVRFWPLADTPLMRLRGVANDPNQTYSCRKVC
jgi:hypothetical protein